jgi:creatinine amidohydrolase
MRSISSCSSWSDRFIVCLFLIAATATAGLAQSDLVRIEDMTWEEVADAIEGGKTTAVYYAGSIEQNGLHMAFGKHGIVAEWVGEQIVRELGNAILYPVMPFAPLGDPTVKESFMAYPGSISLTDETYGAVARDVALSAMTSGFKNIVIMGDHGGGQGALKSVAEELDKKYRSDGVRFHYGDDVYRLSGAKFREHLESHGLSGAGHAGIQDTSEIMYLRPEWIRFDRIDEAGADNGVAGDPRDSSPALGKIFLDMKVDLAVKQIRSMIGS